MGPQATITNAIFNAFLKCKMKASLLLDGAEGVDTEIPRRQQGLTSAFEQSALQRLRSQASDDQVCEGMPPLHALQTNRYSLIINPVITVPGLRAEVQALGSVRTRASQCRLKANPGSCGLQDGQHGHTPPEVEESAAIGGNMLMVAGAEAEEVAQFIVSPAEPGG